MKYKLQKNLKNTRFQNWKTSFKKNEETVSITEWIWHKEKSICFKKDISSEEWRWIQTKSEALKTGGKISRSLLLSMFLEPQKKAIYMLQKFGKNDWKHTEVEDT